MHGLWMYRCVQHVHNRYNIVGNIIIIVIKVFMPELGFSLIILLL